MFQHGLLYVGISRARTVDDVIVLSSDPALGNHAPFNAARNIVYPEVLLPTQQPAPLWLLGTQWTGPPKVLPVFRHAIPQQTVPGAATINTQHRPTPNVQPQLHVVLTVHVQCQVPNLEQQIEYVGVPLGLTNGAMVIVYFTPLVTVLHSFHS